MEGVLKSEIFFFVATVGFVIVAAIVAVVLIYIARILRDVKDISRLAKDQAKLISADMDDLRVKIREEGSVWGGAKAMWRVLFGGGKGRKKN